MNQINLSVAAGKLDFREREIHGALFLEGRKEALHLQLTCCEEMGFSGELYFERPEDQTCLKLDPSIKLDSSQFGPVGLFQLFRPITFRDQLQSVFLEWYGPNGLLQVAAEGVQVELDEKPFELGSGCLLKPSRGKEWCFDTELLNAIERHRLTVTRKAEHAGAKGYIRELQQDEQEWQSRRNQVPLRDLFDPPLAPLDETRLDNRALTRQYRIVLAQLARTMNTVHNCGHLTERDLYRLIVGRWLDEPTSASFLPTHQVGHFSPMQDCGECEKEWDLEEKLERMNQ